MKILSRVFRGKFVAALRRAYMRDQLDLNGGSEPLRDPARWDAFIDALFQTDWVVYAKPAFGGEHVTFQWKDYAHGQQSRTMTLSALEFLRRFVQHILPRRFVRIRQSGFLASTCHAARVALARTLLSRSRPSAATPAVATEVPTRATWTCPRCGATMIIGPILTALQLTTFTLGFDTS